MHHANRIGTQYDHISLESSQRGSRIRGLAVRLLKVYNHPLFIPLYYTNLSIVIIYIQE